VSKSGTKFAKIIPFQDERLREGGLLNGDHRKKGEKDSVQPAKEVEPKGVTRVRNIIVGELERTQETGQKAQCKVCSVLKKRIHHRCKRQYTITGGEKTTQSL